MTRLRTALAACSLSFAAATTLASVQSSASITGLTFELIDLAPDDGIDPSFTFVPGMGAASLQVQAWNSAVNNEGSSRPFVSERAAGSFSLNGVRSQESQDSHAQVSMSTDALTASGYATASSDFWPAGYSGQAQTGSQYTFHYDHPTDYVLQLSANSSLRISGDVNVTATAMDGLAYAEKEWAAAGAWVHMSLCDTCPGLGDQVKLNLGFPGLRPKYFGVGAASRAAYSEQLFTIDPVTTFRQYYAVDHPAYNESRSLSSSFGMVFENGSKQVQSATLLLGVEVSGWSESSIRAVPEPSTYVLFLIGLGALGTVVRHQRHQLKQA